MKQFYCTISLLVFSIAVLSQLRFASAAERSPVPVRPSSAPVSKAPPSNTVQSVAQIDEVKVQLTALKAQLAAAQAKIDDLKKEVAANKQEAKFTATVLTTGVNKMGEDVKALASDYKSHTHTFSIGNGLMSAASLFASLKQNPNYNVTLMTASGQLDNRTGPPSAK